MPVATIAGETGSAGPAVGRRLAERLGADLVDRSLIALLAARTGGRRRRFEGGCVNRWLKGTDRWIGAATAGDRGPDPQSPGKRLTVRPHDAPT